MAGEHDPQASSSAGSGQSGEAAPTTPKPAAKPAAPPAPKAPAVMETQPWEGDLSSSVKAQFGTDILESLTYLGQGFFVVSENAAIPLLEFLKTAHGFDYLVDVTAVDYSPRTERFNLIYIVYSFSRNERIRIKIRIAENARPQSAVGVHLTANWLEREVFDMFGIEFAGHPDLRRILMPDDWSGHPLRKDYSILRQDALWVKENLGIDTPE